MHYRADIALSGVRLIMIKQNIMPDSILKRKRARITDRNRWPRCWWYPVPEEDKRHLDVVGQLHESYAKTINKTMFALLGVGFYCLLKVIGESDKSLIVANTTIQTPVGGTSISFQSFLWVAPFLLVILAVYLHIVYGHWLKLERRREFLNDKSEKFGDATIESIPALFSFKERLPRFFTNLVFYWFVPLTLWIMAYKAFALKESILWFSGFASIVTILLLFLQINRCPDSKSESTSRSRWLCWILSRWGAFGRLVAFIVNVPSKRWFWNLPRWVVSGVFVAFMVNLPSVSKSFRRPLNLPREDLKGAWLQGLDMEGADMNNVNLQGANLAGANLRNVNLQNASLQGANLKRAHLQNAHLNAANLQGTNIGGANFDGADLFSADFREAKEMELYRIQKAANWNRAYYTINLFSLLKLSRTHNDDLEKIGTYFQGGKIAYILQPGDTGYVDGEQHGLIAAEEDIKTIYTDAWDKVSVTGYYRWSTGQYENENKSDYASQALFNTSIQVGDGKDNTDKILAKYPAAAFPNSAAAVARAYRGGGYDDWFLPSQSELNQLYLNRSAVGGFVIYYYWSSTELGAIIAWGQYFGNGYQYYGYKYDKGRVRPVRAF